MYRCERWTIKKAERQRIDACELCCWRRLLRVPWIARRSNQSILKEISPVLHWKDRCWSSNSTILWPCDWKYSLTGKDPDAGKDWRQEKGMKEDEMVGWHHWLNGHESEEAPGVGDGQGKPGVLQAMGSKRVAHTTEQLNWFSSNSFDFIKETVSVYSWHILKSS